MSRLTVEVYNRAGVLVASPEAWWLDAGAFLDELHDTGSFSLNIQADDPDLGDIGDGMILQYLIDATPAWRGVLRRRTIREVAADEAGRYSTLIGFGEVNRLDEMVVYPAGGLGRFPFSDSRDFNWTAIEFDDSGWDAVVVTPANYGLSTENYGLPEGFPDGDAEWIWDEDSSGSVAAGTKYMRGSGTAASTRVREAWGASDDTFELWLQGISVLRSGDTAYVGKTSAVEMLVSSGAIQAAARVTNLNALKAGFLFSLLTPLDDSEAPTLHTDSTWLVKPGADPLGMNAGEILVQLFAEATARGEDPPAVTFTTALDSEGDAWTVYEELSVQVGATYWDVLRQMVDLGMCEFRMSPDAYELNLYNPGGAGTTVAYTLGDTNLTSLTFETVPALTTALLVRYGRGYTDTEDAGQVTTYGRRVSLLALGGVNAQATAEAQADAVIADFGEDRSQVSAGFDPEDQASEPYTLFRPGDSITCPTPAGGTSAQRVTACAPGLDEAGNLTWTIALNSVIEEAAKRQQVMLKRLANGSVGGRSNTSTVPIQPRPIQPRDPLVVDWSEPGPVVAQIGAAKTFERAIRVRELRVELLTASTTGDVTVELLKDGVTVATVTVLEGNLQGYTPVTDVVYSQRPANKMQPEVTAPGVGADTITISVVYA